MRRSLVGFGAFQREEAPIVPLASECTAQGMYYLPDLYATPQCMSDCPRLEYADGIVQTIPVRRGSDTWCLRPGETGYPGAAVKKMSGGGANQVAALQQAEATSGVLGRVLLVAAIVAGAIYWTVS